MSALTRRRIGSVEILAITGRPAVDLHFAAAVLAALRVGAVLL
ncbi:hypothetical protein [Actinoplanes sp. NPDC089786]